MKALVQLILNATAAGKDMLLAANAAAQKVLLSLGNVDNTSDANKPVSTAQQTALDLKANLASPTFTGTVGAAAVTTTGLVSMGQNSSSPTLALSNTTGLQAQLTDGTRTVGLLALTSSGVDALFIRNRTNTGNANLEASRGTFAICRATGNVIGEALVFVGMYTVGTLPSASGNDRAIAVVTDSTVAMAGNYGATVAGGGSNKVKVFSNGTNWLIA